MLNRAPADVVATIQGWLERRVHVELVLHPRGADSGQPENVERLVVNWNAVSSMHIVGLTDDSVDVQPESTWVCDFGAATVVTP